MKVLVTGYKGQLGFDVVMNIPRETEQRDRLN